MAQLNLSAAKEAKNDEFYTQLSDIQAELKHYNDKFKGKVVFCNCDDPFESNFVKYFLMNFNRLELKELIATGYKTSFISGKEKGAANTPCVLRVTNTSKYLVGTQKDLDIAGAKYFLETEGDRVMTHLIGNFALDENGKRIQVQVKEPCVDESGNPILDKKGKQKTKKVKQDLYYEAGDFRSDMSIKLLEESDIVVTNPPFSLFREFMSLLIKNNKQFLVIGNLNAVQNKDFFPYILESKVWMGATYFTGGAAYFIGPKELYDPQKMSNPKNAYVKGDYLYWRVNGVRWYTNLDHPKRHQMIPLDLGFTYKEHESMYPAFENYKAINVDNVNQIPCDYKGEMGVPISFMDKFCPEQFEIIGLGIGEFGQKLGITPIPKEIDEKLPGHSSVWRTYYMKDGEPVVPYGRIIVKFTEEYINTHSEQFNTEKEDV